VSATGRESNRPKLETDPRFPSGEWKGFYLQRDVPGRQWMALALEFSGGRVAGEGRDSVGEFLLRGVYELKDGRCTLVKTYPGSHDVLYTGSNEGDGKWLWGVWRIHTESGGFHLWPKGEEDPTQGRTSAAKEAPVGRKVRLELEPV
jgi:hypothetical protein